MKHAIIIEGLGRTGFYDSPDAARAAANHISGRTDWHGTWVTDETPAPENAPQVKPKKSRKRKG